MSTNAITTIKDEYGNNLCAIYKQWDGDIEGYGIELVEFLKDICLTNGINSGGKNNNKNIANGMSDLAAQIVAKFKDGPGGVYLYPPNEPWFQDYGYEIYCKNHEYIYIKIYKKDSMNRSRKIYSGAVKNVYDQICK